MSVMVDGMKSSSEIISLLNSIMKRKNFPESTIILRVHHQVYLEQRQIAKVPE
jgi:hypothetical protein